MVTRAERLDHLAHSAPLCAWCDATADTTSRGEPACAECAADLLAEDETGFLDCDPVYFDAYEPLTEEDR